MVNVPIHQAAPPLSTPIIDLSPPNPSSTPVQELIITATTTTTILPLPPPPPTKSTTYPDLDTRFSTLVYTLKNHDLYSKIDKQVNEVVKEAVYNALQAPLRKCFRDFSEFQMKEILCDWIRRDDQDPPPPPPKESDRSKKKKQDSDASASKKPHIQKSSAWKTSDTREGPFSSSKQKSASQSEQPVNDDPIPEDVNLSESEDTGVAHLPKIKTRPD
ncbi:hypothetical protein Tco_1077312, partial [Tanacetum coccineum]